MRRTWIRGAVALAIPLMLTGCGASRDAAVQPPAPTAAVATAPAAAPAVTVTALAERVGREWSVSGDTTTFSGPIGVDVGPDGSVYVVDGGHSRIVRLDSSGEPVSAWGARGKQPGQFLFAGENILYGGVAVDRDGNVYATDSGNHRVQKFDADGRFLQQWETRGRTGPLVTPVGIDVDPEGNIYISDNMGYRVVKYGPDGTYILEWGKRGVEPGQFNQDLAFVATDSQGHVYVADRGNARVQVFDGQGQYIREVTSCAGPKDMLMQPGGVAVDGQDNLYISEWPRDRICKYNSSGAYLMAWGRGEASPAQLLGFADIAADAQNNVYGTRWMLNGLEKYSQR